MFFILQFTMEKLDKDIKTTEWDSSWATLQRIDRLMNIAHNSYLLLGHDNSEITYYRAVLRLYVEGKVKFDDKELMSCEELKNKIKEIFEYYKNSHLSRRVYNYNTGDLKINMNYDNVWGKVMPYLELLEQKIIGGLDRHQMLIRDSKSGMQRFQMQ